MDDWSGLFHQVHQQTTKPLADLRLFYTNWIFFHFLPHVFSEILPFLKQMQLSALHISLLIGNVLFKTFFFFCQFRKGLTKVRLVMKGLGAGFHQPVDGVHCLSLVSHIDKRFPRSRRLQTTLPNINKMLKNVKIIEFYHHIWNHHTKCIKISTSMPSIGSVILR